MTNSPARKLLSATFISLLGMLLGAAPAAAGDFTVNPIRLELGRNAKSGAITVRNEGQEKLSFQVRAMEWTQDAEGKDQYADTQELVYFPKLLTTEPGEARVIRIGTKFPLVPKEKTYRLFIEELPGAPKPGAEKGAQVSVLIRFGAPIFVKPLKQEDSADIEKIELSRGELALLVRNTGNAHQMVEGIHLRGLDSQGNEAYALTLADRYLLAGTAKRYTATIPRDQCGKIANLAIELKTDKLTLKRSLEVSRAMCQ